GVLFRSIPKLIITTINYIKSTRGTI
ncbi:hypothetical protein L195_g022628, partial [Trifolium pratense]